MYPVKLSFKSEGDYIDFLREQKLREFVASRLALQEMLKDLQKEGKQVRNSAVHKESIREGIHGRNIKQQKFTQFSPRLQWDEINNRKLARKPQSYWRLNTLQITWVKVTRKITIF